MPLHSADIAARARRSRAKVADRITELRKKNEKLESELDHFKKLHQEQKVVVAELTEENTSLKKELDKLKKSTAKKTTSRSRSKTKKTEDKTKDADK